MNVNYNAGDCEPSPGQSLDMDGADESMQHVLHRVHELYGQRFKQIDEDSSVSEIQRANMKIEILLDWIKSLFEQNKTLMSSFKNLADTIPIKMKQIHKKHVEESSVIKDKTLENEKSLEELLVLSRRVQDLEMDQKHYQIKIDRLESDNHNLLQALKQVYSGNDWNFEKLDFYETNPSDVLRNVTECGETKEESDADKQHNFNDLCKLLQEQQQCIEYFTNNIFEVQSRFFGNGEHFKLDCNNDCKSIIEKMSDIFGRINSEFKTRSDLQERIRELEQRLLEQEKDAKENREALSAQVVREYDKVIVLKNELQIHEEHIRTQSSKIKLKDEHIKKLMKEKSDLEKLCQELSAHRVQTLTADNNSKQNSVKFSCPAPRKVRICPNIEEQEKECDSSSKALKFNQLKSEPEKTDISTNEVISEQAHKAMRQQYQLMEEFRLCTVEAQAATEDLHEETESVITNFNERHKEYRNLTLTVNQVLDFLQKSKQNLGPLMSRVELQEDERKRQEDRLGHNKDRLKILKNSVNRIRTELSHNLEVIQKKWDYNQLETVQTCCDLLIEVDEEIDHLLSNASVCQVQNSNIVTILSEIKEHLSTIECTLQSLHKKSDQVLHDNKVAQDVYLQQEEKLKKLEQELDCSHTKMQNLLENFRDRGEKMHELMFEDINDLPTDDLTIIKQCIQIKRDYHKLRKDYDELKIKLIKETNKAKECESINEMGNRVIEFRDQIEAMRNELVGKQEANNILKMNIKSMEKEVMSERTKTESHRKLCSAVNVEFKRKIIELEKAIDVQKDIERDLRKTLENNDLEIQNYRETLRVLKAQTSDKESVPGQEETMHHTIKNLTDVIQSERSLFLEFVNSVKYVKSEETTPSIDTVARFIDTIGKFSSNMDHCFEEITELKNDVSKKDKLLNDKEEIIRVQKDSIAVLNSNIQDFQQKYDSEIESKEMMIKQFKDENKQLLNQIELQTQTIGHLQDAVVEAKRCRDQMGHKAVSDSIKDKQMIQSLKVVLDETQRQYRDCFDEVMRQDKLLEKYKASVDTLKTKIENIKCCQCVLFVIMYLIYSFSICSLQDQLKCEMDEHEQLKEKMAVVRRTKQNLRTKLQCQDELFRQKNAEIVELKRVLLDKFSRKNKETQTMRRQLKDAQSLTDVQSFVEKSTFTKREDGGDVLSCQTHLNRIERSLDLLREEVSKSVGCSITSVGSQTDISISRLQNENTVQELRQKLYHNDKHNRSMIFVLQNELRMCSKKLAEMEADYQVLQNENSILKKDLIATESKANTEIRECKNKEKQFYSAMQIARDETNKLRCEVDALQAEIDTKNTKINELQMCQNDEVNYLKQCIEKIDEENENLRVQLKQYKDDKNLLQTQVKMLENNNSKFMNELELIQNSVTEMKKENQSKDEILADYTRRIVDRSKLYNQTESIVCSIREWLDGQNELLKNLYMRLKNKERELERLVCEKELLAFNYKRLKMARENLVQKLKRYQKRTIRKTHKCLHLRNVSSYSNIKKKNCIKVNKSLSSGGHSWMFPNLKYVSDNLRQLDRYYSFFRYQDKYFCDEENISPPESHDSDTTLITSR